MPEHALHEVCRGFYPDQVLQALLFQKRDPTHPWAGHPYYQNRILRGRPSLHAAPEQVPKIRSHPSSCPGPSHRVPEEGVQRIKKQTECFLHQVPSGRHEILLLLQPLRRDMAFRMIYWLYIPHISAPSI